jgi:hypothetical protein
MSFLSFLFITPSSPTIDRALEAQQANQFFELFDEERFEEIEVRIQSGVSPNIRDEFGKNLQTYNAGRIALIRVEDDTPEARASYENKLVENAKRLHKLGVTDIKKATKIATQLQHKDLVTYLKSIQTK